ncbi:beta-mannosidase [Leifsonia shinshuensis]
MKRHAPKLLSAGTPATWIGVNFWSAAGGPRMWSQYDPARVRSELLAMRELGMPLTRSFFYWPDFMPTPDALDPVLVDRYRHFLDLHVELGMRTIPTFIVGHMSGQNWDPAWRNDRAMFGDVWFVGRQAWYVRELTRAFAEHPAVEAWLLTNEIPIYGDFAPGSKPADPAEVGAWAQILVDAVRAGGGRQPVSIGDGAWGVEVTGADNGFRIRQLEPLIDFHGPHVYRSETDQVRQNLGAAFICELLTIGRKPVVLEEFGLTTDYVSAEHAANYYRQTLHNTLLAGCTGWLAWNNTDYDSLAAVEPYSHHPFEMHFGLTDEDGRPKPQALEVQKFAQLAAAVDFSALERPDAQIAIITSAFLEKQYPSTSEEDSTVIFDITRQAYIAAREADLAVGVVREADGIPEDCALYIVPSAKHLTAPTWRRLRELAEAGALVYASAFYGEHDTQRGLWWTDVDENFGVTRLTRYGIVDPLVEDTVTVTVDVDFGPLRAGDELTFPVAGTVNSRAFLRVRENGAEVIARDQHGNPALLRHRVGAGSMILGTLPVEYFAARTPFINPEPTWRLYEALAEEAGVDRELRVDDPRVLAATMVRDDGTRFGWLVSESEEPLRVVPQSRSTLYSLADEPLQEIALAPYGVEVVRIGPAS